MAWKISLTPKAAKELKRLGAKEALRIKRFLVERVSPNPRALGGALKGELREFWRWRVGDYRVLGKIEDDKLLVLVVKLGHRSDIYQER